MKVSVLFSGGKDSTHAVWYCTKQGWEIETLIAVKPASDEAYIWHYPTVEWTCLIAEALNAKLILLECNDIGPAEEVKILERIIPALESDALILGGVGLQETQINVVRKIAEKHGLQVFVPFEDYKSEQLLREEIESGLEIVITEVAAGGLTKEFLGKKITKENFNEFKNLAEKHGFDVLGEGGAYNTFVTDAPFFAKKILFGEQEVVWDEKTRSGHLLVKNAFLVNKIKTVV